MTLLVTGGTNFVLDWLPASDESVINLDKLTYAASPERWSACKAMRGISWCKVTLAMPSSFAACWSNGNHQLHSTTKLKSALGVGLR
jgi:dTDP-D-glucose 4,6-dehydratase